MFNNDDYLLIKYLKQNPHKMFISEIFKQINY